MVPPGDEDVEVEVADEPETVEVGGPEPLVEEVPANNPWNMSFRRGTYIGSRANVRPPSYIRRCQVN